MIEKDYYTPKEVADILNLHYLTILRNIQAGKLKAVRIGRQFRISRDDLQAFIEGK